MKFLFDFFPVLLFFVTYKVKDIYWASGVLMAASVVQFCAIFAMKKKPEVMQWIMVGLVVPLVVLTLVLHNPVFVKWKPTVVNWFLAGLFLVTAFVGEKSMIERMMGHAMKLPKNIWLRLNLAWVIFFVASGSLNLVVAYNCSENTWVNFKLFGLMGLTMVFAFGQVFFLQKYIAEEDLAKQAAEKENAPPPP